MIAFQHDPQETAVRILLEGMGEDSERDGLKDTPKRVVKALGEMTEGYKLDPSEILSCTFAQTDEIEEYSVYEGMVVLRDIEFNSLCEHHLLPFIGRAHVAYIPGADGRIVGISKLARLVDCFAHRLQVQERLTAQIADAIETHLAARGVVCMIGASHFCMRLRGCKKQNSSMVTLSTRGTFTDDEAARAEALRLMNNVAGASTLRF